MEETDGQRIYLFPANTRIRFRKDAPPVARPEAFKVRVAAEIQAVPFDDEWVVVLPERSVQMMPGSSWGTFTIACTIPIALLVSLWMYRLRRGRIVEASLISAVGVLAATVAGAGFPVRRSSRSSR